MTTITAPPRMALGLRGLSIPQGVRTMVGRAEPRVIIAAMLCITVVVLGVLTGVFFLVYTGHGTEAMIGLVGTLIIPYVMTIYNRLVNAAIVSQPPTDPPQEQP